MSNKYNRGLLFVFLVLLVPILLASNTSNITNYTGTIISTEGNTIKVLIQIPYSPNTYYIAIESSAKLARYNRGTSITLSDCEISNLTTKVVTCKVSPVDTYIKEVKLVSM